MPSNRLSHTSWVTSAMLVALLMSAVFASVAKAESEPTRALVWQVEGHILQENETKELVAKATTRWVVEGEKVKVACAEAKLGKGAFIANEKGNSGQGVAESTTEYSKCSVEGNGESCKVVEPISTKPLILEWVLGDSRPEDPPIRAEFRPRPGKEIAELKFEGLCKFKSTALTESELGSLRTDPGEQEVELGALPAETTSYDVNLPEEESSVLLYSIIFLIFDLYDVPANKAFGENVKVSGNMLYSLKSGQKFELSAL